MRPQVRDEHSHAMRWHAHPKRCSAEPTWSPLSIACAASMCGSQREDGDSISHSTDGNTQVSNGRCPSPILLRTQGLGGVGQPSGCHSSAGQLLLHCPGPTMGRQERPGHQALTAALCTFHRAIALGQCLHLGQPWPWGSHWGSLGGGLSFRKRTPESQGLEFWGGKCATHVSVSLPP